MTVRDVSLSGTGYGVLGVSAALSLEGVHIHHTAGYGVLARGGADIAVDRSLVEHTQFVPVHGSGFGMLAVWGAHLSVSHSAPYSNHASLWAENQSSLTALGVLVDHMLPTPNGSWGHELGPSASAR